MQLDIRTILLAIAASNLLMAVGLIVVNMRGAFARTGRLWIGANLMFFIGWMLLMFRGFVPVPVSQIAGNVLLSLALTWQMEAIVLFRNRAYDRRVLYGALFVSALVLTAMHLSNASPRLFISVTSLYNGTLALAIAYKLLFRPRAELRSSDVLVASIETLFGVVALGRALATALPGSTTMLFSETTIQSLFFATVYVASIGASFAFILMTKQEGDETLLRLAMTDPLTGVLNRRAFLERATAERARLARIEHPGSVLMMDLDRFKTVNDTYGHEAGDRVLKRFADVAQRALRGYDLFARYGGEEFVALLPHSDVDEAQQIAQRILESIAGAQMDTPDPQTVSIGVAACERGGSETLEELLRRADKALYRAKEMGRNRVVVFQGVPSG